MQEKDTEKTIGYSTLLNKARAYCARAEQCRSSVREKMESWGANEEQTEEALKSLSEEGYLDECRYATAYCESKIRHGHWSRRKTVYGLRTKGVDEEAIREGIEAVSDEEYLQILTEAARKKMKALGEEESSETRRKVSAFLASRGYTTTEINIALTKIKEQ